MHMRKRNLRAAGALLLLLALIGSLSGCLSSSDQADRKKALAALDDTSKAYASSDGTTIDRQVLLDQDGVEVTLLGLTEDYGDPALLLAVLNTSSRTVSLTVDSFCVNGWLVDGYCDIYDVPPHGAQLGMITMDVDALDAAGVDALGTIDLTLVLYDDDSYDDIASVTRTLTTSAGAANDTASPDAGALLYDRGGAQLSVFSVGASQWSTRLPLALFNTSGRTLHFQADGATVNGAPVSLYFNETLPSGARTMVCVEIYDESYDSVVLSAGDTLTFTLILSDEDYTRLDEQTVTFTKDTAD